MIFKLRFRCPCFAIYIRPGVSDQISIIVCHDILSFAAA